MNLSRWMQEHLSMAKGDVTVALFIAATVVIGFLYTTFIDSRTDPDERRDMLLLERRHDSLMIARKTSSVDSLRSSIASDSTPEWSPLTAQEVMLDSIADAPRSSSGKKRLPTSPVNINAAGKSALMGLPGVGEKTAEAIIAYRRHLPFRSPEDLMNVKGIGKKKFEKLRGYIRVK